MNEELKVIISAEISKLKQGVSDAKKSIGDFVKEGTKDFDSFNKEFQKVGDAAKRGLKTAAGAVAGVTTALLGTAAATAEYRTEQAKLTTAFEAAGSSAEVAKSTYNDLYRVLGDGGQATEAAGHLALLTTNEKSLAEWTNICQGVYATFGDSLPIESLTEAANETAKTGQLTGALADALNWAGISEEDFQKRLEACNSEAEREALIRETLSGVYNEAAATYEKNAAGVLAQNEAQAKLTEATAKLGEAMAPVMTMLTELGAEVLSTLAPHLQSFADKYMPSIAEALGGIGEKIGKVIGWIADNWDIISTVGTVVLAIAAALSVVSTALTVYSTVMGVAAAVTAPVTGTVLLIAAAIAAVIAVLAICITHWDSITEAIGKFITNTGEWFATLGESISQWFTDLIEGFKSWWQDVEEGFADWWDSIKEGWTNFWENVNETVQKQIDAIKQKFTDMKEKLSQLVEETKEKIVNTFTSAKEKTTELFNKTKENVTNLVEQTKQKVIEKYEATKQGISDKLSQAKQIASNTFTAMKEHTTETLEATRNEVQNSLNRIKNAYETNGGGIKGVVAATNEAVKSSFKVAFTFIDTLTNGKFSAITSTIRSKMNEAFNTVSNILGNIKGKFESIMNNAKTIVSGAIEKIKSFFDFKWSLPSIPMPHFSISGSFSLNPPRVPSFGVSWYEMGGIFDKPTLFGYGNGSIGGLGENGAEAVVPLEKNTEWLDRIAERLAARDANTPIVLQVDGKTFAQTSITSINDLTKQTGTLGLVLI